MGRIICCLLFLVGSKSFALDYVEVSPNTFSKKATMSYNKHLSVKEFFLASPDANKNFLKSLQDYTTQTKTSQFWKADIIGETVYLKKNDKMISIQLLEVKTTSILVTKINGKIIELDFQKDFEKNLGSLKSAIHFNSASWLDILLPHAHADEIEAPSEDLEDGLSSAMSWAAWAQSFVVSESLTQKAKFCALNEKEKNSYNTRLGDEELFKEIQFFIKIQNKFVKSLKNEDRAVKSGLCHEKCQSARDFQVCLEGLAARRKQAIDRRSIHGFSCFKRYEDGGIYLNSGLVGNSLETYDSSAEQLQKDLEKCGGKYTSEARAKCKKLVTRKINTLKSSCPPDEKATQKTFRSGPQGSK